MAMIGEVELMGPREHGMLLGVLGRSRQPLRDRALIDLFWYHGPTVRQVLALEVGHVNFAAGRLYWPSEEAESRLEPEVLDVLKRYVVVERNPRCPALFTTRLGHPLNRRHVTTVFHRLRDLTGLPVTPHALRMGSLYQWLEQEPTEAVTGVFVQQRTHTARILRLPS